MKLTEREAPQHNGSGRTGLSPAAERRGLIAILLLALVLRIAFALHAPAWHSPDEYPHYWVADRIAMNCSLPENIPVFPRYEAFQPPLYYVLAAGVLEVSGTGGTVPEFNDTATFPPPSHLPQPSSLLLLRFFSVLLGLLTLLVAWRTLGAIEGFGAAERLASLAFIAFLPTYVGVTSTVNNDTLAILLSAVAVHYALKGIPSQGDIFMAGLAAGLALLTKSSAVIILPLLLLLVLRTYRRSRETGAGFATPFLLLTAGMGIGVGLLLARNLIQYDSLTALMPGVERSFAPEPDTILRAVRNLFGSFWVAFGRTYEVRPSSLLYILIFLPLFIAAVVGGLRAFRRYSSPLSIALTTIAFGVIFSLAFTLSYPSGTMTSWGKNLYPLLTLLAPAFVIGWSNAAGRDRHLLTWIAILILFVFSCWGISAVA